MRAPLAPGSPTAPPSIPVAPPDGASEGPVGAPPSLRGPTPEWRAYPTTPPTARPTTRKSHGAPAALEERRAPCPELLGRASGGPPVRPPEDAPAGAGTRYAPQASHRVHPAGRRSPHRRQVIVCDDALMRRG